MANRRLGGPSIHLPQLALLQALGKTGWRNLREYWDEGERMGTEGNHIAQSRMVEIAGGSLLLQKPEHNLPVFFERGKERGFQDKVSGKGRCGQAGQEDQSECPRKGGPGDGGTWCKEMRCDGEQG